MAKVAERFGGGGHRLASGTVLQTSLEEARGRVLVKLNVSEAEAMFDGDVWGTLKVSLRGYEGSLGLDDQLTYHLSIIEITSFSIF